MHKRIWGSISRRPSQNGKERAIPNGDSPEASVARGVRLFCESGGPNNSGEEVLHLPVIVEAAESSPVAATEASVRIRKFLCKENYQRAYVQYNAIMLMRILADNPGKMFTRNIDSKFVSTVKELLRDGRDMSVQQILRETLDNFVTNKPDDETLFALREMWKKERAKVTKRGNSAPTIANPPHYASPSYNAQQQNYFARNHRPHGLPPPAELSQRVEEAKTSAKLLSQVVQSTPPTEVLHNELIKEFVDRCQSASRSIQSYIHSDNPPPDEDTLLTLIETNDQLATAISRHQRAMLQARRATGISPGPSPNSPSAQNGPFEAPVDPPTGPQGHQLFTASPPSGPPPGKQPRHAPAEEQDPFGDQNEHADDGMQPPLAPSYGLPPSTVGHAKENDQGAVYRPGTHNAETSYGNGRSGTGRDRNGGDGTDDDEEGGRPVQYRF